jgi:hypothetical protein
MSHFGQIYEDPDYYYDLDDEGNWVEIQCDADGEPLVPEPELVSFDPYETVNS